MAFHESDWTISPWVSFRADCPVLISHSLMVKSPEAEASMFSAAGLKRTWPTFLRGCQAPVSLCIYIFLSPMDNMCIGPYLVCPASLLTGATSAGSSASVKRVKSLGTCHMKILPSSEPDAITWSLKGCLIGSHNVSSGYIEGASNRSLELHGRITRAFLPIRVQHNSSMAAEERYLVRDLSFFIQGNDGERATTT